MPWELSRAQPRDERRGATQAPRHCRARCAGTAVRARRVRGLCVRARPCCSGCGCRQPPGLPPSPPRLSRGGQSAAPPGGGGGRSRARGAAALCSRQPARSPARARLLLTRGLQPTQSPPHHGQGLRAALAPSSTLPPPLQRTAQEEANTSSDGSAPKSTTQLCSPLQVVLHSQEPTPGYPGLSLSGWP